MNEAYGAELIGLGSSLTELAVKGTATAIAAKIKAIKNEKDCEKIRNVYDGIINELLSEREEAVRIAQAYKSVKGILHEYYCLDSTNSQHGHSPNGMHR